MRKGCWTNDLVHYDAPEWARHTYSILRHGWSRSQSFIPWPDTQRGWKKHLTPEQSAWLQQFLPGPEDGPVEGDAPSSPSRGTATDSTAEAHAFVPPLRDPQTSEPLFA